MRFGPFLPRSKPSSPTFSTQVSPVAKAVGRPYSRRDFLAAAGVVAASALQCLTLPSLASEGPRGNPLPRWRGFNLTNFFQALSRGEEGQGMIREDDLRWIRTWGFDFVRLPMDYWLWVDSDWKRTKKLRPDDVLKINEAALEKVDRAVDLCRKYGLHLSLNFHRAPGYCINDPEREPFVLWSDRRAEDAFVYHWELFARRYSGEPRAAISFNLINEAPYPQAGYMTYADYVRVMTRATEAIRKHAPDRLVIVDGLSVGTSVVPDLVPLKVAQSVHAYWPYGISHYHASWLDGATRFPVPTWPLMNADGSIQADRKVGHARVGVTHRPRRAYGRAAAAARAQVRLDLDVVAVGADRAGRADVDAAVAAVAPRAAVGADALLVDDEPWLLELAHQLRQRARQSDVG